MGGLRLSYLYNTHSHPIPPSARQSSWSHPGTGGFHRLSTQVTKSYVTLVVDSFSFDILKKLILGKIEV